MNSSEIRFYFLDKKISFSNRKLFKSFVSSKIDKRGYETGKLYFFFCSDQYLLGINKKFLGHDYFTDIITFDWSEKKRINGEIYVSVDRIKENAHFFSQSVKNETLRVLFHGVLHLLGYSDKTKEQKKRMRALENKWIKEFEN